MGVTYASFKVCHQTEWTVCYPICKNGPDFIHDQIITIGFLDSSRILVDVYCNYVETTVRINARLLF